MSLVSPLARCPAPDCEASQTLQEVVGEHEDGCFSYECMLCGVGWSWHLASTLCPMDKEATPQCHQVPGTGQSQ